MLTVESPVRRRDRPKGQNDVAGWSVGYIKSAPRSQNTFATSLYIYLLIYDSAFCRQTLLYLPRLVLFSLSSVRRRSRRRRYDKS